MNRNYVVSCNAFDAHVNRNLSGSCCYFLEERNSRLFMINNFVNLHNFACLANKTAMRRYLNSMKLTTDLVYLIVQDSRLQGIDIEV